MSRKKRVKCVETGEEFPSLTAAGKWAGMSAQRRTLQWAKKTYGKIHPGRVNETLAACHVGQAAAGKEPMCGGYHWEFVDKRDAVWHGEPIPPTWDNYVPPVISSSDQTYRSGRSRVGSDHLRRWVVLSKEKDGLVQCSIDCKWYPAMAIQVAHIRPFATCADEDKYHRDSSLPMSMVLHKLYDFHRFTILRNGTIHVLDRNCWDELNKLDGKKVLGWRKENARFCRENQQLFAKAA